MIKVCLFICVPFAIHNFHFLSPLPAYSYSSRAGTYLVISLEPFKILETLSAPFTCPCTATATCRPRTMYAFYNHYTASFLR